MERNERSPVQIPAGALEISEMLQVFPNKLEMYWYETQCKHLFPIGSCGFAEEIASRRDSIEIQGIRLRYPSSLRIDPLVLFRAQCIAPIYARRTWVSYQYISSWVGSISEISSAQPGIEPETSGMVD
ncbi:hypothetical protein DPMN_193193 [Dreissena polymorpha]|uniref:Uncharacterized protein n=1 Tax=Dreissena polymorpha TaxID=45954 RepID=A0A9D3Y2Q7_DREPO|nr:hypothetical protein DPMN_193193 [Dreissena polymorpha]